MTPVARERLKHLLKSIAAICAIPLLQVGLDQKLAAASEQTGALAAGEEVRQQQLKQRGERLRSWQLLMTDWCHRVAALNPEQQQRLDAIATAERELSQERWADSPGQRGNFSLPDYAPVEFTSSGAAAELQFQTILQFQIIGQLSDEQLRQLTNSEEQRAEQIAAAYRDYLTALLHEQLLLNDDQRVLLRNAFRRSKLDLRILQLEGDVGPLTSLSRTSVAFILQNIELTEEQRSKCVQLRLSAGEDNPLRRIDIRAPDDVLIYELNQIAAVDKQLLENEVAVRVAVFADEWQLTGRQIASLKLAGRGAVIKSLNEWKSRILSMRSGPDGDPPRKVLAPAEGMQPGVSRAEVFSHPVWTELLNSMRPEDASVRSPGSLYRSAFIRWIVAVLDGELWLSPDQLQTLTQEVERVFPADVRHISGPLRELSGLATVVQQLNPAVIQPGWTEKQQNAWKLLQEQFQYEGNSVKMRQNDGKWLTIPLSETRP